jgi:hypothetical protein
MRSSTMVKTGQSSLKRHGQRRQAAQMWEDVVERSMANHKLITLRSVAHPMDKLGKRYGPYSFDCCFTIIK